MSFLTTATPRSLDSLPTELLENILKYLRPRPQGHLARCVRVNRAWNGALTPFLWQTLDFERFGGQKQFLSSETQQALSRNAMFVQYLGLDHYALYLQLLPPRVTGPLRDTGDTVSTPDKLPTTISSSSSSLFTNLNSLELCPHKGHPIPDLEQRITTLVLHNPGIKTFRLKVTMDPTSLVSLVTKHMPHLQRLFLSVAWHGNIKTLLYNLPSCIQTIAIDKVIREPSTSPERETLSVPDRDRTMTAVQPHWDLETLIIDREFGEQEVDVIVPFLESCSRKLSYVSGLEVHTNPVIVEALTKIGYVWEELLWHSSMERLTDAELASIVRRSTQWTGIWLPNQSIGPLTASAIVDRCQNLISLGILRKSKSASESVGFMGHHLQAILSKASNLVSVMVHWNILDPMITAREILSSEWASTSLVDLQFKIRFEQPYDAASENSIQRLVLQRLGRQTRLKNLLIGSRPQVLGGESVQWQDDSLKLSLESGLDELVNLKNLENLEVCSMRHRIGVSELEWIVQNLPKLQLQDLTSTPISPETHQWLTLHRPTWM